MFITARTGYANRSRTSRRRETVGSTRSSPREPGTRIAPGPREDGHTVETVGFTASSLPEPGMRIAPGPRENGRTRATVAATPRKPGYALGSSVDDTSRNISRVLSTTSSFEAPGTSWIDSQDVRVALRWGYGNTESSISSRALRSRSSRKTSRNLPLNTVKEEGVNIFTSDLQPDPCEARDSSLTPDAPPAANEPVGNKRPPGLTDATPLAPINAPPHPEEPR